MVFDLAVLGTVLLAMVIGARKGFLRQTATLGSVILGVGLGVPGSRLLAPMFPFGSPIDRALAIGAIYLVVSLLVHLLAAGLLRSLERRGLGRWDRHLGALSGALWGFAVSLLVTLVALTVMRLPGDEYRQTHSGKLMGAALRTLHPAWPDRLGAVMPKDLSPLSESDPPGPIRQGPL